MALLTRFERLTILSNHKKVTPSDTDTLEEPASWFEGEGGA